MRFRLGRRCGTNVGRETDPRDGKDYFRTDKKFLIFMVPVRTLPYKFGVYPNLHQGEALTVREEVRW